MYLRFDKKTQSPTKQWGRLTIESQINKQTNKTHPNNQRSCGGDAVAVFVPDPRIILDNELPPTL